MKRLRITIGMVMIGVVVLAVNFALFRWALSGAPDDSTILKIVVSAPMTSALLLALVLVSVDLRRRGDASPFGVGVCFIGALVVVASDWAWHEPNAVGTYIEWVFWPVKQLIQRPRDVDKSRTFLVLATLALAIPQVVLAAIGGWIASRIGLRLTIVRRSAKTSDLPETVAAVVD